MNTNQIRTECFSNPDAQLLYESGWKDNPTLQTHYENGEQCGGCSFFAPFNFDWGLCCHRASRHHLETVFEHFTCANYVGEGWGPHSFSDEKEDHCWCQGEPREE